MALRTSAERSAHPFRFPTQPDDRVQAGLRCCSACVSVRIIAREFAPSRNQKRLSRRNADLLRGEAVPEATREQFALLRAYLNSRHAGGGMSDMGLFDYVAMVEETPVNTHIVEYREASRDGGEPASV